MNEAVAKAGGFLDIRANPGQVFLYRMEYRETLEGLNANLKNFPRVSKSYPLFTAPTFAIRRASSSLKAFRCATRILFTLPMRMLWKWLSSWIICAALRRRSPAWPTMRS